MHALFARLRRRITFANVTSSLALFVALGGTSYAAISVGSAQIRTNAVGASEIRAGAVGKSEIRTDAVAKAEIRPNAVGRSEVRTDGIGASELAPGAVRTNEIADGAIEVADFSPATRTALTPGRAAVSSTGVAVNGNAKSAARTAMGVYTVEFDRDVSACTYGATLASVTNGTTVEHPPPNGHVTVAAGDASTKVVVNTFAGADGATATDSPFHLLVVC